MTERVHNFWADQPGAFVRVTAQRPMLWALIGSVIAGLEIGASHFAFFRGSPWPAAINDNAGWVVLFTSTIVAAATFVFLRYFFAVGDAGRYREILLDSSGRARVSASASLIIVNIAIAIGMAATQLVFWARGPWAHLMMGIRGPDLPLHVVWWPLVFVPAAIVSAWGLVKVWHALRDEALDVARATVPKEVV